jgi:hypothetical protein
VGAGCLAKVILEAQNRQHQAAHLK